MLGFLGWRLRRRKLWLIGFSLAALVYPLLAFTSAKEIVFLLGGHLGELAFAGVFFWRALSGGFTNAVGERIAYSTVAWYFVGCNVWLSAGLIWSLEIKLWYANSGSFGLTNDYIRLADNILGWRLETVAALMLLVTMATLPVSLLICRLKPN